MNWTASPELGSLKHDTPEVDGGVVALVTLPYNRRSTASDDAIGSLSCCSFIPVKIKFEAKSNQMQRDVHCTIVNDKNSKRKKHSVKREANYLFSLNCHRFRVGYHSLIYSIGWNESMWYCTLLHHIVLNCIASWLCFHWSRSLVYQLSFNCFPHDSPRTHS